MERLFLAARGGTARVGTRFALLRLTLLFALLLGAVWSNAAMATFGCEIQPVGATFKSGAPGSNVTFAFNIVSITGGCGPSVGGTVVAGTDTTGGASAAPVNWSGAPGSTVTITVTIGPNGGGQAAYTIKCSADCFNGKTSIPITAMVNDTYVLTPNTPTTVTALEQSTVPLSVKYLINGAASSQDTSWVVDQPTSAFLGFATVTPDASGNADNSFTSFAAGTYVVTVSGGCPTAVAGCPPPPVNFTINVEHPVVAIVAPA
ncbi:MAG: hypothetical protein ABIW30_01560, partial [Arenimonas sp.]